MFLAKEFLPLVVLRSNGGFDNVKKISPDLHRFFFLFFFCVAAFLNIVLFDCR